MSEETMRAPSLMDRLRGLAVDLERGGMEDRQIAIVRDAMGELTTTRAEVERLTGYSDTVTADWMKERDRNRSLTNENTRYKEAHEQMGSLTDTLRAENEKLLHAEPTGAEVNDACLSYRHDFGLLSVEDRESVAFQATEWLKAWRKTFARAALATTQEKPRNG